MTNRFAAIGLGALIALAPLATLAQTASPAPASTEAKPMAAPSGSHRSQMRHTRNMSKQHARAGAHHMRKMGTTPASAPKP
jgi:hypothetical protein